ncbi:hypothetical protein BYT27DRAFT_7253700 [Phlegmacium glaucopus]|nr:hypothetical protein BYT27DRAFT_7253700 [Phlegmacium glaucopus]
MANLSRDLLSHSSSRTPYDNISFIVKPYHPVVEESSNAQVQVSSALTRGYLYAAATPMSIFGSLGMVRAGFKTLVACFSFGDIEGAKGGIKGATAVRNIKIMATTALLCAFSVAPSI